MKISLQMVGDDDFTRYVRTVPDRAAQAMRMAINSTIKSKGRAAIKSKMLSEVAFPASYLNSDRLKVTRLASNKDLEAVLTGRKRATSLARFLTGHPVPNSKRKGGVTVRVKKGRSTYLKDAFVVRLNKGASLTEDGYNLGLAVRLQPGEQLSNKRTGHKSWLIPGRVALLYGPSVDQVFSGAVEELQPKIADMVSTEFFRQFERIS